MQTETYHAIGLMSGTSLDGLDIAYCKFEKKEEQWHWEIMEAETIAYPSEMQQSLKSAIHFSALELVSMDVKLGYWMGEQVKVFKNKYVIRPQFVATHGHTVFHQPKNGITVQIGDLTALHLASNLPVIGDFRKIDVLKGGQGAPLVPIGDNLLFSEYNMCLNLGGIANLSFQNDADKRIAYDICPCNLLLNHLAKADGLDYDKNGEISASGTMKPELLQELNQFSYYEQTLPKSLGLEQIEKDIYPLFKNSSASTADLLATSVEHISEKIVEAIKNHLSQGKLLITGGGTYNQFLIEQIKYKLGRNIVVPDIPNQLIDYKEALIFAFLGVLNLKNERNILSSVTGASSDSVSGQRVGKFPI
ncbi:anhydro-N-acetylmuramic acid kinase [Marivirga sp. S37H4]|uniref:Anhydro-N-acetylmuramic acid kinase n=1 Tax=Marivirga aurantiaca TaxID=2802615 RepID=A0A935C8P0_9BACT|nr:anhydro-N-acetylmuramic acid kinase [Marivirga aurantiaca]MBK6265554.1 anhydro-N-acetylmuramic acid kinase [Marivirga aurantiaca]